MIFDRMKCMDNNIVIWSWSQIVFGSQLALSSRIPMAKNMFSSSFYPILWFLVWKEEKWPEKANNYFNWSLWATSTRNLIKILNNFFSTYLAADTACHTMVVRHHYSLPSYHRQQGVLGMKLSKLPFSFCTIFSALNLLLCFLSLQLFWLNLAA